MEQKITVYGASWCSDCRRTKKYLGEQRLHYDWRDIESETVEGKSAYNFVLSANKKILGVPKRKIPVVEIVEDRETTLLIEPSNTELAERLGLATTADHDFHDVIIIGAGPAGLTAAIYLAREGYDVLIIEQSTIGGQSYITNRLDNYPGFPDGITGEEFANNLKRQAERFNVEILTPHEVDRITTCHADEDFERCTNKVVKMKSGLEYTCAAVLVASGSTYRELIVPGVEDLVGTSVHYCATCDAPFYKNKALFAVGGGNSAFEESLFLQNFADHVTILVRGPEPSASPVLQEKVIDAEKIDVWLNSEITEVRGKTNLENVLVHHKEDDVTKVYQPDGIFVFIELSPNTKFVPQKVERDSRNFIVTSSNLETTAPGIFAAGDCRKGAITQVVAAAGEGAAAAIHIREFLRNR